MKRRTVAVLFSVLLPLVGALVLSGCGRGYAPLAELPEVDCRGYDFDKRFPGNGLFKPFGPTADYDSNRKRLYDKDGLFFRVYSDKWKGQEWMFEEDLEQSPKEQAYLEAYYAREREFDRVYAGEIKAKLKEASELEYREGRDYYYLYYPLYLEREKLPSGVASPASIFSDVFFYGYVRDEKGCNELDDFILLVGGRSRILWELSGAIAEGVSRQLSWRFESLYAEYILTWYHLKEYESPEERSRVVRDLATYYSDVAFRAAAEETHEYAHWLNAKQRCAIADYVAKRVSGLIMTMEEPARLEHLKRRYKDKLTDICFGKLQTVRALDRKRNGEISDETFENIYAELKDAVYTGKERCVND